MARTPTLTKLCFWITAILTLAGVTLRSLSMLLCFDAELGYLDKGILPALSDAIYPIAVVAAAAIACMIPKGTLPKKLHTPARLPLSILMGIGFVAFSALGLILCLPTAKSKLLLAPLLVALLASLYFFLSAKKDGAFPDWLSLLGFLPILWGVTAIAQTYTDMYTPMNSPVKITLQLGFVGLMLILIAELRFRLSKPAPRMALALWSMGSFLCLNGSVPVIVAACARVPLNLIHILYAVVLLFGGAYGGYILWQFAHTPVSLPAAENPLPYPTEPTPTSDDPD